MGKYINNFFPKQFCKVCIFCEKKREFEKVGDGWAWERKRKLRV